MFYFGDGNSSDSDNDEDYKPGCSSDEEEITLESNDEEEVIETVKTPEKELTEEEEKARNDDLIFKNFLAEVAESERKLKLELAAMGYPTPTIPMEPTSEEKKSLETVEKVNEIQEKSELCDFAGETLSVAKNGESFSVVAEATTSVVPEKKPAKPGVKRQGLDALINNFGNKKRKMSTLEKSQLDWNVFKKESSVEDELTSYSRDKGNYMERMKFLERSDLKSFEIEREMRLKKRKKPEIS